MLRNRDNRSLASVKRARLKKRKIKPDEEKKNLKKLLKK